ncbi:DUF6912 family protein [Varibaculum vaginae]|uniref:DUF6912 family protein n=1 Tax=Varibaculum vaginae TaxID=2364797 RepID=UPI000F08856E|nr:hypothetical protein [Varibaculum vaginae]
MRIYLPLTVSELSELQLYSRFAWAGNDDFCQLWGIDFQDGEQAEDMAMSMAAMACLEKAGEAYPGRIVAALDADASELITNSDPGVFEVKTGFDWRRMVSLHVDSREDLELCRQVRNLVSPQLAALWCRGRFSGEGEEETPEWELWEALAAQPLSWYDQSELDYLRRSLPVL